MLSLLIHTATVLCLGLFFDLLYNIEVPTYQGLENCTAFLSGACGIVIEGLGLSRRLF
jgi:hypothetical protein